MSSQLIGASVWEQELYEHLESHAGQEQQLLGQYQEAGETSGSTAFAYLVSLIIEDEKRHHRFFAELAESLRSDAEFRPEQPRIPRMDLSRADQDHIGLLTRQLLDREHDDAKELKRLAKELSDVKDTTLWSLLVELMEADTAKHIRILEFVQRHSRP